nr:uncharacterized mitochondrial protein AtMg00810-like [Tanacetum cinerariifolium]
MTSTTDSTTEPVSVVASVSAASAKIHVSALPNVDTLSNAIDADDLEEMDLKWQMAMLTVRARRFLQWTGRNHEENGPNSIGYDMSKVECYNCHRKGNFTREYRSPKDIRRNVVAEPQRRNVPVEEEPTNYALMAFTFSSTSSSNNEVASCSKSCTKAYATLQSHYDKLTNELRKSQFDVLSYQTGLESIEARLLVYQQNETVFEKNIKLLKLDIELRDKDLVVLRQNDELFGYESDKTLSVSPTNDRYQSGDGYHAVPPPYTGTFMPPKPDLASAHIIEDWVSDSEDDSEPEIPYNAPSFVQPTEHVKPPRPSVQHSKLVPITAVRPVTTVVPKTNVTRPRHAKPVVTKPHSPPKSHINRSLSPKASTFSPKVTTAKAPMVNAVKGVQGKWEWKPNCPILDHGNPQHSLKDKRVIDSGCSRHMTGNMSYLSDFEEINGGYVAFGRNPKGDLVVGKIFTDNTNTFSVAGPSNTTVSPTHGKSSYMDTCQLPNDPNMPKLEDITYFDDEADVGAEVDFTDLETTIIVSPIPTTRVHEDHPVTQIIGHLSSDTQTRSMTRVAKDQGRLSQINNDDFNTCMFACFLSQEEPKRVHQALKDPSWIEAMQEELLQFKMQKVWVLVDLPNEKRAIGTQGKCSKKKKGCSHSRPRGDSSISYYAHRDRKSASTPIDTKKPLLKDPDVKRIFRYVKGKPHLGLWYPKDSSFNLVAYSDSDYAGASLDRKSTIGGCQFLGCRLISWQCKKQTVVATSSTKAEYIAAAVVVHKCYGFRINCWIMDRPLFKSMIVAQEVGEGATEVNVEDVLVVGVADEGAASVADDDVSAIVDEPSIPSPTLPTQPPPPSPDIPFTSQKSPRNLLHTLLESCITLTKRVENLEHDKIAQALEITKLKQKNILSKVVIVASATITAADATITVAALILTTALSAARRRKEGKGILVQELKPLKKKTQIEQDVAYAKELEVELNKNIDWDEVIDQVKRKEKEDNDVMRYQALKRKPQTEAQARKNKMIYLRNMAGFKMDYFKGMTYDDIRPIFEKKFNSNVAFLEKTKEQMEEEDNKALKRISESQEILVKERFASTKPKNFLEDFLLTTLGAMFEKPDVQAQIWRNQRSVHGLAKVKSWKLLESCGVQIITFTTTQLILLVERKYPLTRFTLDQMLNNVQLEVEEESEVSLELLRFFMQQHQEGFRLE